MNLVDGCQRYIKRIIKLMNELKLSDYHYEDPLDCDCSTDGISLNVRVTDNKQIIISNMERRIVTSNGIRYISILINDIDSYYEGLQKVYDALCDIKDNIKLLKILN